MKSEKKVNKRTKTAWDNGIKQIGLNAYLSNIIESIAQGVVVIDKKGMITTFNRAAEILTDLTVNEVIGKKITSIFNCRLFKNVPSELKSIEKIKKRVSIELEIDRNNFEGSHMSLMISPLIDSKKRKKGAVLTLQDITRMKKLEEQANRTDRLAAMGEMAVKIAHEIRNPLGSIELFSTSLMNDLRDSEALFSLAEHISSGVKSINTIISNLLLFIKPHQVPDFRIIDINNNLNEAMLFLTCQMRSFPGVMVDKRFSLKHLMIRGDCELLKQMSLNIILNAIQAMPQGGELRITTRETKIQNHRFAEIEFSDTGDGISQANISKIFDPFFTTKSKGTGLGLAIVHNIVKLHNGTIEIKSSEQKGTKCTINIPLCKDDKVKREYRCVKMIEHF